MTRDDERWMTRHQQALGPLAAWLLGPGHKRMGWQYWRLRVYAAAVRVHRWLWVRGIEV